jgi:hypothetical protein
MQSNTLPNTIGALLILASTSVFTNAMAITEPHFTISLQSDLPQATTVNAGIRITHDEKALASNSINNTQNTTISVNCLQHDCASAQLGLSLDGLPPAQHPLTFDFDACSRSVSDKNIACTPLNVDKTNENNTGYTCRIVTLLDRDMKFDWRIDKESSVILSCRS